MDSYNKKMDIPLKKVKNLGYKGNINLNTLLSNLLKESKLVKS